MSDRKKCIPLHCVPACLCPYCWGDPPLDPPDLSYLPNWEDHAVYRSLYLDNFTQEEAAALEDAARPMYSQAVAGRSYGPGLVVAHEMRVAARDLEVTASFLRDAGCERFHSALDEDEARLAERVERFAWRVAALARELREAAGPTPESEPDVSARVA